MKTNSVAKKSWALLLAALVGGASLAGCSNQKTAGGASRALPPP